MQEKSEAARRTQDARAQLVTLDAQYRQAKQHVDENLATYTLREAGSGLVSDPMTLLRAKELLLKRKQRLLNIETAMYAQYLNLLDWSGAMSAEPLVNYLSDAR